jgi:hypothetical protein
VRQTNKIAGQESGINGEASEIQAYDRTSETKLTTQSEIHIDSDNNYYEVSTYSTTAGPSNLSGTAERKALEKAEINLNDCLACR